jgi:hypothetical protein
MWLVHRNKVQTTNNMGRKEWKDSKFCQFCQAEESVDHLMFKCPIAVFVCTVLRDSLKWREMPKSVGDFKKFFLMSQGSKGVGACGFCLERFDGPCGLIGMISFLIIG